MRQRSKGFDLRIGSLNRMYCATERRPGVTFRILRELLITAPRRHCQYPRFNRSDVLRESRKRGADCCFWGGEGHGGG